MKTKRLWNNKEIEVVEIDGRWFALYGWNGEAYCDCWETDEHTFCLEDGKSYEIRPVYKEISEDEFEIIGYEIV